MRARPLFEHVLLLKVDITSELVFNNFEIVMVCCK